MQTSVSSYFHPIAYRSAGTLLRMSTDTAFAIFVPRFHTHLGLHGLLGILYTTIESYLECNDTSLPDIWPCVCSTGSSFPFPDPEYVSRSPIDQNISRWRQEARLRNIPCTSDRLWAWEAFPRPGDIVRWPTFVRRRPLRRRPCHRADSEVWTSPIGSTLLLLKTLHVTSVLMFFSYLLILLLCLICFVATSCWWIKIINIAYMQQHESLPPCPG